MFTVVITEKGGAQRRIDFARPEVSIGRVQGNDVILRKGNVSKRHARLTRKGDQFELTDLNSTNGTYVNGRKLASPRLVSTSDKIYIADFILTVEPSARGSRAGPLPGSVPVTDAPPPPMQPQPSIGANTGPGSVQFSQRGLIESVLPPEPQGSPAVTGPKTEQPFPEPRFTSAAPTLAPITFGERQAGPLGILMSKLGEKFDVHITEPSSMKDQGRWNAAQAAIAQTIQTMTSDGSLSAEIDAGVLADAALHEAVGLGALDALLSNDLVREIVIRGINTVLTDTGEGLQSIQTGFSSRIMLQTIARRLAAQAGRRLGQQPIFHGVLSFGPQVTIIQAPLAVHGPVIEIRSSDGQTLEDLQERQWLTEAAREHLERAVAGLRNIAVIGPHGSGVSTVLSALVAELSDPSSAVAIEAVPDLSIDRDNVVSLCSANTELDLAALMQDAGRLRVDRLIIDDVTGIDVREALTAFAGREPGHMAGIHAAGSAGPIAALTTLLESAGLSHDSTTKLIASTVNVAVQVRQTAEGHRVLAIVEVQGLSKGKLSTKSLFSQ